MSGVPSLAGAHRVEIGGGQRHAVIDDRGQVVNVILWDGTTPYEHPPHRRADGSTSHVRLLRHDTLAVGERVSDTTT
jgi:hypothetical protein